MWRLLIDGVSVLLWLRLLITVASRPSSRWKTGRIGKYISVFIAAAAIGIWAGVVVPFGAALVWWRVIVRTFDPFELPMADGRPMP